MSFLDFFELTYNKMNKRDVKRAITIQDTSIYLSISDIYFLIKKSYKRIKLVFL